MRQDLSLAALSAMTGCPACAGHDTEWVRLRLRERPDDAGRALGMAVQRLDELVSRQAGLERIRLEVGGNQGEGVVMRRARGRAGAEIMRQTHQALAADIFLGLLRDLSLRKAGHGDWNAVSDPMADAAGGLPSGSNISSA